MLDGEGGMQGLSGNGNRVVEYVRSESVGKWMG